MYIAGSFAPKIGSKSLYLEFDGCFNSYFRITHKTLKGYQPAVEGKLSNNQRHKLLKRVQTCVVCTNKIKNQLATTKIVISKNHVIITIAQGNKSNSIKISIDDFNKMLDTLNFDYDIQFGTEKIVF